MAVRGLIASLACVLALLGTLAQASASRVTYYGQEQVASPKSNQAWRYQRVADGALMADMLGPSAAGGSYANLTVTPVTGLTLNVMPSVTGATGSIYQLLADDPAAWGGGPYQPSLALAADPTEIVVHGVVPSSGTSSMTVTAPGTSGQSQDALIECAVTVTDGSSASATFVTDILGDTTSQTVNRDRLDLVSCQVKEGTAATTGTQTVPTLDSGYVAVGYATIPYGTTTVTSGMITASPSLTFLNSYTSGSYTGSLAGSTIKITFANGNCGGERIILTCPPYNATGNGSTDDTSAINAAITASSALGGTDIYSLPNKTYAVSSTIDVTTNNIKFVCLGAADGFHNSGNNYPSCALKWIGTSGGTIMAIQPVISTSNPSIDGDGVIGFAFQSNGGSAGVGLTFAAADHGKYESLYFDQFSSIAFQCSAISTTSLLEAGDTQYNDIRNITIRNYSNSGVGLSLDGTANSDCSLNNFTGIESETDNGNAVSLNISDNNNFFLVSSSAIGTGDSLYFSANTTGETFHNWLGNKAPIVQAGSNNNTIFSYEAASNGVPFPVIPSGSNLNIYDDRGVEHVYGYSSPVEAVGDSEVIYCRADSAFDANATVNNCNGAGDNLNLLQDGTAYRAGFGFDGSGNLRMVLSGALSLNGSNLINAGSIAATTETIGSSGANTATGLVIGTAAGSAGSNITASSALTAQGVGGGLLAVGLVGGTTELALSVGGNIGVVGGATFGGGITSTTATHSGILTDTVGGDALQITNATNADILFGAGGVGAPTFTTRSVGTKLVLYPNESGSSVDYGIGVSSGTEWFETGAAANNFAWYAGTTSVATLSGAGALALNAGVTATSGGFTGAVTGSSFATSGTMVAGSGTATTSLAAGDIAGSRSTTTGVLWLGGTTTVGALDFGVNTVGSFTFNMPLVVQGNVTETNVTDSALTSGNCVQASTGGLLTTIAYPCAGGVAAITANEASGTSETQVVATTVPANTMVAGTTYHIQAFGQATVTAAGTITFRIRIGSTGGTVVQSLANSTVVGTAINFHIDGLVTCRTTGSSGTAIGRIYQVNGGTTGLTATADSFAPVNGTAPTTAALNTTQSNVVELTQQASATTSTATIDSATIIVEKT